MYTPCSYSNWKNRRGPKNRRSVVYVKREGKSSRSTNGSISARNLGWLDQGAEANETKMQWLGLGTPISRKATFPSDSGFCIFRLFFSHPFTSQWSFFCV